MAADSSQESGGTSGTGGASSGTGGASSGTGGTSSGTGGTSSGTGGTSSGTGGASGTGGTSSGTGGTIADAGVLADVTSGDSGCPPPPASPVAIQATKIGAPTWKPIDYQSIPTVVGTSADTSPTITAIESVVSPGHTYYPAVTLFGPSQVHAPPYDMELTTGRELAGLVSTSTLNECNFHAPSGLLSMLLLVPDTGAPTGQSHDFATGPILENALFPLIIDGDTLKNGVVIDPAFDSFYPGTSVVLPASGDDGYSHIVLVFATSDEFVPVGIPVPGAYVFSIKLRDQTGAGWDITTPYSILP